MKELRLDCVMKVGLIGVVVFLLVVCNFMGEKGDLMVGLEC